MYTLYYIHNITRASGAYIMSGHGSMNFPIGLHDTQWNPWNKQLYSWHVHLDRRSDSLLNSHQIESCVMSCSGHVTIAVPYSSTGNSTECLEPL